jgi:hypothetical protein
VRGRLASRWQPRRRAWSERGDRTSVVWHGPARLFLAVSWAEQAIGRGPDSSPSLFIIYSFSEIIICLNILEIHLNF